MRKLLLLPALLFLPACDKAEEKSNTVAPAVLPPEKPKPKPAPVVSEAKPAPVPPAEPTAKPPPPPPTPEELDGLQKEAEAVLALGAPLMEGGTVEDEEGLRTRVIELLKRRGKMIPGMSPEQRAESAKQFAPVMQLRTKLMPQTDIQKKLEEARARQMERQKQLQETRSRLPAGPNEPATPAPENGDSTPDTPPQ